MAKGAPVERSVWNSLEIARLVMSAATPIAIFVMGYVLSQQSARQNADREKQAKAEAFARDQSEKKAAALQASQLRTETLAREDALRRADAERDEAIRRAADARDDALRSAAEARDDALRRDAIAREEGNRRETLRLARIGKLFEKRGELWEQLGPKLSRINTHLISDEPVTGDLRRDVEESERTWKAYVFYFPQSFNRAVETYLDHAYRYARAESVGELDMDTVSPSYEAVLAAARSALDVTDIDAEEAGGEPRSR